MLSVVIETKDDDEELVRTLASLVSAAVEGIVRDVVVFDRGSNGQTRRVAEHAGCHFVAEGGIAAAVRQVRGEWLLMLESGARPIEGWTESVIDHVSSHHEPARLTQSGQGRFGFFASLLGKRRALAPGLIVRKEQAISLAHEGDTGETLARRISAYKLPGMIRIAARPD